MPMRRWKIRYRIGMSQAYAQHVQDPSQADANWCFDAEMPGSRRCGSAQTVANSKAPPAGGATCAEIPGCHLELDYWGN